MFGVGDTFKLTKVVIFLQAGAEIEVTEEAGQTNSKSLGAKGQGDGSDVYIPDTYSESAVRRVRKMDMYSKWQGYARRTMGGISRC